MIDGRPEHVEELLDRFRRWLEAARIGEIAASKAVVLHELTPMASLEEAFMELTSGSLEFGQHGHTPVTAAEGSTQ